MESHKAGMNEHGLYDIYEQWHVPFWQTTLFYVVCAIVCLIIVSIGIYYAVRHYRSKRVMLSPWDQALRDLNQLKQDNIATAAQGKQFYSRLTAILKKYVHQRYGFDEGDALAKTDQEFIEYLYQNKFGQELVEQLQAIFMGSMVVKFANVQAIQEQIEKDLALAISFIKRTQPTDTKK